MGEGEVVWGVDSKCPFCGARMIFDMEAALWVCINSKCDYWGV